MESCVAIHYMGRQVRYQHADVIAFEEQAAV
jgi:hypothetical protein